MTAPGPAHQRDTFVAGISGARPSVPASVEALERAAERAMSPQAWAYVAGGAGAERTMAANRAAFDHWKIVPRMLRDSSARDLSVELFGAQCATPFILAPVGVLEMVHPESDLAVARAARSLGVPMVFSNQASVPMEAVSQELGGSPHWFQMYWSTSNALVESFVRRAEACGCSAIVLTLDTTMLGWRPRDIDLAWLPFVRGMGIAQYTSDPVFRSQLLERNGPGHASTAGPRPRFTIATLGALATIWRTSRRAGLSVGEMRRAVQLFVGSYSRPSLTWEDLPFLRGLTKLPIVLKGIQHADDARRALDAGVNGIVVSNHGGRQVDGAIGSLDALPGVIDAVGGHMPVLFDSGVRTGADAFKALALGARAVLIGRPYAYALAIAGEAGVTRLLQNLIAELDLTMGLAGHRAVRDLTPDALARDTSQPGR